MKNFKLRLATGLQLKLSDAGSEWQLGFGSGDAHVYASEHLSREKWLAPASPDESYPWVFVSASTGLSDVLDNLLAAGIKREDIEVDLATKEDQLQAIYRLKAIYAIASDEKVDAETRLYAHRLYAELRGWIEKSETDT
jgi:hypothetical protein